MIRLPLVQSYHIMDISVKKIEITRKGKDGLVCRDNIRADITVAFYIRVDATEESVRKVAQMLTPERVSDIEQLRELLDLVDADPGVDEGGRAHAGVPGGQPPDEG